MELVDFEGEQAHVSIPLGGPIYISDLVGPITRVSDFEASVLQNLQDLEAELCPSQECDEDISVDELKIITEEDLVNKAFEEAFKDGKEAENSSQRLEEVSNAGKEDNCQNSSDRCLRSASRRNPSSSHKSLNTCPSGSKRNGKRIKTHWRKGNKKEIQNSLADENDYMAKVEQLAKIKQKQEEDKAAARLHSFSSCKIKNSAVPSEKIEKALKSMRSASKEVKSSSVHAHVPVVYPEVVLSVEVYHNARSGVKTQEFLVLGMQTLTELRDKIYCLTDQLMEKAGKYDPSGYFLIEDIFCNDMRDPSAIDYSEPIFDWLKNSKEVLKKWQFIQSGELTQKQQEVLGNGGTSRLPPFRAVEMQKTRFCDLRFRVGAGYMYCHQGACKHTIVIRDMRLIHKEDVQNRAAYPIITFQLKFRTQKCSVCKIYVATQVTVDDKWAGENPCYFCANCYYLLHYTKDGNLLYNEFEVYDYHHEV